MYFLVYISIAVAIGEYPENYFVIFCDLCFHVVGIFVIENEY